MGLAGTTVYPRRVPWLIEDPLGFQLQEAEQRLVMMSLDTSHFDAITALVGDTPFSVTACFFLQRRACNVFADDKEQPRHVVIVPHTPTPDVYVFGPDDSTETELESLADFLAQLDTASSFMVPSGLVQPIRARLPIDYDAEGLCFTFPETPEPFHVWRPELVRQLAAGDGALVEALPDEAGFLYQNFDTPSALLAEGLAFGIVRDGRLASMAASLALTDNYCDVGVYTLPRYRHLGYATDCVEALFAHVFAQGRRPLWRIGVRQKVAIYFAEKLKMEEIGTNGQEVYLQARPVR
jgi:GNAT superfamily N-acetyltransferase